jgi:hypothetical protein
MFATGFGAGTGKVCAAAEAGTGIVFLCSEGGSAGEGRGAHNNNGRAGSDGKWQSICFACYSLVSHFSLSIWLKRLFPLIVGIG